MLKQWESKNMGCFYVLLPDGTNRVLTSDGVLIEYETSKNLTKKQYEEIKSKNSKYDYRATVTQGKLVQKKYQPAPIFDEELEEDSATKKTESTPTKPRTETAIPIMAKRDYIVSNEVKETGTILEKESKTESRPMIEQKENKDIGNTETAQTPRHDYINITERLIMLCVSIMTIILSIYYTKTYLSRTNGAFIATILSVSMLLYSLIGLQLVTLFRKRKNYVRAVLFLLTSLMTIAFSMFTSLDVNITGYLANNRVIEEQKAKTSASTIMLESIQEQKRQNRQTVDMLVKDIEYYQKRNLNTYSQREQIKALDEEYKSLSEKEMGLLTGNETYLSSTEEEDVSSLVEILGKVLGMNKNVLQMLVMCFASIFIDILAPLALNIAIFGKRQENERIL